MKQLFNGYPVKESDIVLAELGYSLQDEYRTSAEAAEFRKDKPVLDIATGSGRMAYTLGSLGLNTITGDIDTGVISATINRIGSCFNGQLSFTVLDAMNLSFPDKSFYSVVSADALHEYDEPMQAVKEMVRVAADDGKIMVLDFNAKGFDVLTHVHQRLHGKDHRQGFMDYDLLELYLHSQFKYVKHLSLDLNDVWVAYGKHSENKSIHSGCFACGTDNPDGLHLAFISSEDGTVSCETKIPEKYQGYKGVVQGGIVSTLLDSAMTNCLFAKGINAMTARLNVKFINPLPIDAPVKLNARLLNTERRIYNMEASIEQNGKAIARATAKFMPIKIAM